VLTYGLLAWSLLLLVVAVAATATEQDVLAGHAVTAATLVIVLAACVRVLGAVLQRTLPDAPDLTSIERTGGRRS
jgi:uncharacterized protein involved in response to NO